MKCTFCSEAEGLLACGWPTERWLPTAVKDLAVGDQVHRRFETDRGKRRPPAVVAQIHLDISRSGDIYSVAFALTMPSGKVRKWRADPDGELLALRPGQCGQLCCERHRAERSERTAHCSDHWMAWARTA